MKIIAKASNNKFHVEVNTKELNGITGSNEQYEIGQIVNISSKLSILHQLVKNKGRLTAVFTEFSNVLNNL